MKTEKSWTPWQRNLNDPMNRGKNRIFAKIGTVIDTTDTWDPFFHVGEGIDHRYDIYESVWKQVQEMRTSRDF